MKAGPVGLTAPVPDGATVVGLTGDGTMVAVGATGVVGATVTVE